MPQSHTGVGSERLSSKGTPQQCRRPVQHGGLGPRCNGWSSPSGFSKFGDTVPGAQKSFQIPPNGDRGCCTCLHTPRRPASSCKYEPSPATPSCQSRCCSTEPDGCGACCGAALPRYSVERWSFQGSRLAAPSPRPPNSQPPPPPSPPPPKAGWLPLPKDSVLIDAWGALDGGPASTAAGSCSPASMRGSSLTSGFDEQLEEEQLAGAQLVARSHLVAVLTDDNQGRAFRVADPPHHNCIAFTSLDFEGDRQRQAQQHVPALINPRTKKLIQEIQFMGRYPKKSSGQRGMRHNATSPTPPPRPDSTPPPRPNPVTAPSPAPFPVGNYHIRTLPAPCKGQNGKHRVR